MVSFINNVIVGMEMKGGHNKIVEEVVRRLVENNLYMKPEKYKWKVKEVGFLRVIIKLKEIKMEKVKVKDILNWPTLKGVKDIQKFLELVNYYY